VDRRCLLLVALGACADPRVSRTAAGITAGVADRGDDGVAALLRDGEPVCTATLIAPSVLVTAAHCVDPAIGPTHAFFGVAPPDGDLIAVVATEPHPSFDPIALDDDIAVVLLDVPAAATPCPLPSAALDPLPGRALRLVGFGATGAGDSGPAAKRTGSTVIASATERAFRFGPQPSQTCAGDSGGPGFIISDQGDEVLAGVTSAGDPDCAERARDTRVDVHVDGFLAPYLDADAGCGGAGGLAPVLLAASAVRRPCRGRRARARRGRSSSS
jgi:hypothetical protein